MSQLIANLLADPNAGSIYRRPDVAAMDSVSSALPAESYANFVVDGVTLHVGDRVLYTALAVGANKVYVVAEDLSSLPAKFQMVLATDSRDPAADGAGVPYDSLRVISGTVHAQQLMVFDGVMWDFIQPVDLADSQPSVAIANLASGGSVGAAAATVDVAKVLMIDQTTASQTITLPSPTAAATVRTLFVLNTGSASFTMLGQTVAAGAGLEAMWGGAAWFYIA